MSDKVAGFLEVGLNERGEVVINHPDLKPDENGVGHIVFSSTQAYDFAQIVMKHAIDASRMEGLRRDAELRRAAEAIPVDRGARVLSDGSPVPEDESHRELKDNGQQRDYVVLSAEERAKGFVRPVRRTYTHLKCGSDTTMSRDIAETYARDPKFYTGTFCTVCRVHLPLDQFVWAGTEEQVGS